MFDFQQKRRLREVLASKVTWSVLLLLALLVGVSAYDRFLIAKDVAERRFVVEQEITKLEARREELKTEVEYLNHERGQEAEMRRQFDIARPGEQVVIILDSAVATTNEETVAPVPPRPWYRFW